MKNLRSIYPQSDILIQKKPKKKTAGFRKSERVEIELIGTLIKKNFFTTSEIEKHFLLIAHIQKECTILEILKEIENAKIQQYIKAINAPVHLNFDIKSLGKFKLMQIMPSGMKEVNIISIKDQVKKRKDQGKTRYLNLAIEFLNENEEIKLATIKGQLRDREKTDKEVALEILSKDLKIYKTKQGKGKYFFNQPSFGKFHINIQGVYKKVYKRMIDFYDEQEE